MTFSNQNIHFLFPSSAVLLRPGFASSSSSLWITGFLKELSNSLFMTMNPSDAYPRGLCSSFSGEETEFVLAWGDLARFQELFSRGWKFTWVDCLFFKVFMKIGSPFLDWKVLYGESVYLLTQFSEDLLQNNITVSLGFTSLSSNPSVSQNGHLAPVSLSFVWAPLG